MFNRVLAAAAFALVATGAQAVTITFDSFSTSTNSPATGAAAQLDFSFADAIGGVSTTLKISNTTGSTTFGAGATQATLTGVGFDVLGSLSGGVSGGGPLDTLLSNVSLPGSFGSIETDIGLADNNNFLGGQPSGLTAGQMQISTFLISTSLSAADYQVALQDGFNNGVFNAIARFQQVNAGEGSDKLLYNPDTPVSPVPLPAGGLLLLTGLGGLAAMRARKKKA